MLLFLQRESENKTHIKTTLAGINFHEAKNFVQNYQKFTS